MGFLNIKLKLGDGYWGWDEFAPFDRIIITAAVEETPSPIIEQLTENGKIAAPIGKKHNTQTLYLIEKDSKGKLNFQRKIGVRFVPFIHDDQGR